MMDAKTKFELGALTKELEQSKLTDQEKIEWMITFHRSYIANMTTSVYEMKRQIAVWESRLLSLENELRELQEEKK